MSRWLDGWFTKKKKVLIDIINTDMHIFLNNFDLQCAYLKTILYTRTYSLYILLFNNDINKPTVAVSSACTLSVSKCVLPLNEDRFLLAKYGNEKAEGGKL